MIPSFIYKGISSSDIDGLIVNKLPTYRKPEKKYERIEIDGKDGDVTIDNGYAPIDKKIEFTITDRDFDFIAFHNWLTGAGKLVLSKESDFEYDAEIFDEVETVWEDGVLHGAVIFHCQPWKHMRYEPVYKGTDSVNCMNHGFVESKPLVILKGSGKTEVRVNGIACCEITIDDGAVTLDSEIEDAYNGTVLKNRNMLGEFPRLQAGMNTISCVGGNVTSIEVHPKSRWL